MGFRLLRSNGKSGDGRARRVPGLLQSEMLCVLRLRTSVLAVLELRLDLFTTKYCKSIEHPAACLGWAVFNLLQLAKRCRDCIQVLISVHCTLAFDCCCIVHENVTLNHSSSLYKSSGYHALILISSSPLANSVMQQCVFPFIFLLFSWHGRPGRTVTFLTPSFFAQRCMVAKPFWDL